MSVAHPSLRHYQIDANIDDNGLNCHHVYCDDCISLMRAWRGPHFRCPLIFADPPFNIGQNYDSHDDRMKPAEFYKFTEQWLCAASQLLTPNGIMCVNIPDDMVGLILSLCPLQRIDWIIWHYRFGQCGWSKFISSHQHCLVYRNGDGPHTFNADDILVESDRSSKYNDSRTLDSETPGLRVPLDVLTIPRITGNSKERLVNHPNQLPEAYLTTLIKAYSNAGEFVLDPFGGSGTTAICAKRLGRWSVSIEKSAVYCADIVARLERG